ncbi:hypothetical protein JCM16303_006832 [Sporobolomyces ruberrimus]
MKPGVTLDQWPRDYRRTWVAYTAEGVWGLARKDNISQPGILAALKVICDGKAASLGMLTLSAHKLIDSGRNDGELKRENHERVSFGFSDDEEEDFSEGGNTSEAGDMDVDD